MAGNEISGVYAALLTPRDSTGLLNERGLANLVRTLSEHALQGFVLNGATGEFCLTTRSDLQAMLQIVNETAPAGLQRLCGIGSTSVEASIALAETAADAGVHTVLLPTPFFYPYAQEDVFAFCTSVADRSPLPVLLYNLPQFTSPIALETALRLIGDHPNITGIKDSSGSLEIVQALTDQGSSAWRVIGNDAALVKARRSRLCDAVISGVACVLPELILQVFEEEANESPSHHTESPAEQLAQLLQRIAPFPTPWAIKWLAEARGFVTASFAQTLSPGRLAQGQELQHWFQAWWTNQSATASPIPASNNL
jgi:4-hydroxy-tetrahydrodipicolinate synthase